MEARGITGSLAGRRIVVTRAAEQAGPFSEMLKEAGAEVIEFPTIETVPPDDYSGLDRAIAALDSFDYAIFTSVNAVEFFLRRLGQLGRDASELSGVRLVAVGPKTARCMEERGLPPDIVPREFKAEGVVEALSRSDLMGRKILYPRAETAREVLPEELRKMGAEVEVAAAYRTVAPKADPVAIGKIFSAGVSAITFTSSSTVRNFMLMAGDGGHEFLKGVCVACIGPVTARTCEEMGIKVSVVPEDYTVDALLRSLADFFDKEKR